MIKLEDTAYFRFCTVDDTGAAVDADSTPTVSVEEDGVAMGGTPATVANVTTGIYRVTVPVTAANSYEAGKRYNVMVSATVGGIASSKQIAEFLCTSVYPADIAAASAAAVMAFVVEATGAVTLRQVVAYMAAVLLGKADEMDDGATIFYSFANAAQARVAATQDGNTRPAPTLTNTGL